MKKKTCARLGYSILYKECEGNLHTLFEKILQFGKRLGLLMTRPDKDGLAILFVKHNGLHLPNHFEAGDGWLQGNG